MHVLYLCNNRVKHLLLHLRRPELLDRIEVLEDTFPKLTCWGWAWVVNAVYHFRAPRSRGPGRYVLTMIQVPRTQKQAETRCHRHKRSHPQPSQSIC